VRAAVVVPVKAFRAAKARLAPALSPAERADLARTMATGVLRAAGDLPVTVVCDDDDVRTWALDLGAAVCWSPGLGLDGAVAAGVASVAADVDRAVVVHADLPLALDLRPVVGRHGILLVPDRHGDGTNVISLPVDCGFEFAYGPGSFRRHRAEATRLGLPVEVHADAALAWDVDVPGDLDLPAAPPA
jgi:2-phospho-L-lactate guanylyltransferase